MSYALISHFFFTLHVVTKNKNRSHRKSHTKSQHWLHFSLNFVFLLLARYVPNVAKEEYMRSV